MPLTHMRKSFPLADGGRWEPRHSLGGHVGPVVDLSWGFGGRCLLSASTDQTARILTQDTAGQWLEIARPQVLQLMTNRLLDINY